ncbi:MAG: DUF4199 domain-containing protein [Bacteroidia bacterium]|nr:DUF4199 domain-containing protein [Bacteroidia bacterium]
MKKVVVSFGLIAGVIVSAMLFLTMYLYSSGVEIKNGELIGYTTMIIAFSTIFFGIRTYRDQYQAGTIRFGKAFQVGLFITIIASFMYVASWMIISAVTGDAFIEQYTQK